MSTQALTQVRAAGQALFWVLRRRARRRLSQRPCMSVLAERRSVRSPLRPRPTHRGAPFPRHQPESQRGWPLPRCPLRVTGEGPRALEQAESMLGARGACGEGAPVSPPGSMRPVSCTACPPHVLGRGPGCWHCPPVSHGRCLCCGHGADESLHGFSALATTTPGLAE